MNPAEKQLRKFSAAMRQIAVGARLRKIGGTREWQVLAAGKRRETSVEITVGCGLRMFRLNVPICVSGPCLMDVGMEAVWSNTEAQRPAKPVALERPVGRNGD